MMSPLFSPAVEREFRSHPRFAGVRISVQVAAAQSGQVGVSFLEIDPGVEVPVHVHDTQIDSIFVLSGEGQAWVNGAWRAVVQGDYLFVPAGVEHGMRNTGPDILSLFVHHSPPIY